MEKQNAKFAFFYLLSLVALVFTALATGLVIFQIINKKVVDLITLAPGGFSQESLKFAISAIIIAAPIYFVMMWLINKNILTGKLDKESGIRKWLTYFILLVSAVVMIGWLIGTINSFLNGELTIKFILKALTAIIISALIFSFYLYDIKRADISKNNNIIKAYFYGSMAIVLAALVASFFFIDSPRVVRLQKYDQNIINKFSQIDNAINAYYGETGGLPSDLNNLLNGGSAYYVIESDITDPDTNKFFEYKVDSQDAYELCSTFKTENKSQANDKSNNGNSYYVDLRWLHDSGYQCLKQRIAGMDKGKPLPVSVPVR
ncbi:MAG: hypothetical protein A2909_02965 [Candidatus Tagabacteria bacterium RIFCSPLOWO2_01_FULL_39_11]|uniref:DUF5671 domain-containing protein n=1 Tax=Candidatus Tagabacteria bacterium RIFCSPLOWO2_01_FULL_39_11 TaxID=1802295 RepID=A0A1G2LSG6_9BACT|nr:MAG: hypothetical protein A2909_02965 [Candidatus Tagabacteria bacterium RIFCSPLOWO2_01_FULL_39_11]